MIKKYFLIYFLVVIFFSVYSHILDFIFYKIEYGNSTNANNAITYAFYFMIVSLPTTVPLLFIYNIITTTGFDHLSAKHIIRILFALIIGFIVALFFKANGPNYYLGKMASLKNLILYPSVFLSVEIARIFIERRQMRKNNSTKT